MKEGHLFTEGIVKGDYPETMRKQIESLPADAEIIIHHIKSPGGNVYAAWKAIPELMKIGKPIESLIEGEASSIASWLAVAPATRVRCTNPSTAMIHEPFFPDGIQGSLGVDDLETAKVELAQIRQSMAEAYAKKSGRPVSEWLEIMRKNTRLTAQMLKSYGLVDEVIEIEPRRIAAELIEEFKNDLQNFKTEVMNIFKKTQPAAVAAVDLPVKGGGVIHVESENGDLVNKPVTIDGKPAEGTYQLEDGRVLMCSGGIVTEVKQAEAVVPQQETPEQKMQKLQAQLDAMKAAEIAKAAAEEAAKKTAAEQAEKDKIAAELKEKETKIAAMAVEIDKLKKQTMGDDNAPNKGGSPFAIGSQQDKDYQMNLRASRTFIAENFPHWEQQLYPSGKFKDGKRFSDYRRGGPEAVSLIETSLNYTWNGILDIKSLFYTKTLSSPALSDIFTIDTGAANNKRYHIIPALDNIQKPYTGCDQAVTGSSVNITSKNIQLKPLQVFEKFCKDDFTDQLTGVYNVLAQEWLKTGNDSFDPAGTPIDRIIMDLLKDAIRRCIIRRASFGDTSSSSLNYNQIDGLITSLIDQSGASNYCVYREGAALGTGTLAADTAATRFTAMYNNSPLLLKEHVIDANVGRFLVTRSMWENYYTTLVGVGAVTEQAYNDYKTGAKVIEFRGIPVVPVTIWDSFLAEPTNPLNATTRHLALLTTKDNHILGVENTADMLSIKSWFEEKDNARYYRNNMTMGVLGSIMCELTTIAY